MAETDHRLQPPGAGLPTLELVLSRMGFWLSRLATSRQAAEARFLEEGERIGALARGLDPTLAVKPVLIPRLWGIEDSSRHWSALMVLEHLIIVNKAIATIIEHLTAGKTFPREVSIAAVKPSRSQDLAVIDRFAGVLSDYVVRVGACRSLRSKIRHDHPWFGPLDAHGWHCLAAIHQTIHRRQIEAIIRQDAETGPQLRSQSSARLNLP